MENSCEIRIYNSSNIFIIALALHTLSRFQRKQGVREVESPVLVPFLMTRHLPVPLMAEAASLGLQLQEDQTPQLKTLEVVEHQDI